MLNVDWTFFLLQKGLTIFFNELHNARSFQNPLFIAKIVLSAFQKLWLTFEEENAHE